MRFGVLASSGSWYLKDLRRAAAGKLQLLPMAFSRLSSLLESARGHTFAGDEPLGALDALLVRTMPPGSLEQVVFRMDVLGQLHDSGTPVVNSPRAIETAVDKFLASARLQQAGLRTPRTFVCQTVEEAMSGFEQIGGDVVVKPLFGSEGRGIVRLCDPTLAARAFQMLERTGAVIYQQEYIPHEGYDLRLLVIDGRVLAMRRRNALDWRTNVSRGAQTEAMHPDEILTDLARRACHAVGTTIGGVDVLPGRDGRLYTIEVNAVPGWKSLAKTLQIDVAALVLEHLEKVARRRRDH